MGKIRLHYGAADRNKDKFIFDSIACMMPIDTILLVPDQYTLQAERNAFEYMNTNTLFELAVMSRTSFIHHITEAYGGIEATAVDDYGRFMLLSDIAAEEAAEEIRISQETESALSGVRRGGLFDPARKDRSFINMMNDLIAEMKQFGISAADFEMAAVGLDIDESELLREKLLEIARIYSKYEKIMEGKFSDREDLQMAVIKKIPESERVAGSIFWVDGLETVTPVTAALLEAVAKTAVELNIVISDNGSGNAAFNISAEARRRIKNMAYEANIKLEELLIPEKYIMDFHPEIHIVSADNFYTEAENAAIHISELVREKGYRYRDFYMLCNDMDVRGSVIRRVFDNYEIPLFIDTTKIIYQDPAIQFMLSMLDIIGSRRRIKYVFSMLKTGYGPLGDDAVEKLENYCVKYNIRNGHWKKDFIYGVSDEGEDTLIEINKWRSLVEDFLSKAESIMKGCETVTQKTRALWNFLSEIANIPEKLESSAASLEAAGNIEYAERTGQIWQSIIDIFDQLVEVLGERVISDRDYMNILRQGFEEVRIGILPTNNDQVICGALPRSLTGRVKVMFILGANEGVLPAVAEQNGLLSDDEKRVIEDARGLFLGRTSDFATSEHKLALYLNMKKVEDLLYISFSQMDIDGNVIRPSELVTDMLSQHRELEIEKDLVKEGAPVHLAQNMRSTIPHITSVLRKLTDGEVVEKDWYAVLLALQGSDKLRKILEGIFFDADAERVDRAKVLHLYGKEFYKGEHEFSLRLSASAIEQYSKCPFSFFLSRGLRPEERRPFKVDMRSIGDIYHECMRSVSSSLTKRGTAVTSEESPWMNITKEECSKLVSRSIDSFSDYYREGVFDLSQRERYTKQRIEEICLESVWLMISQVRAGNIKAIYFERIFGNSDTAMFPGISIELDDGNIVVIEGKIDRVDVIEGEDGNYVKIIDYKSGYEKFDIEEVEAGWRLQLMIYLRGAMGGIKDSKPAGVFYFRIDEADADVKDVGPEEVESKVLESFRETCRLDGIFLEEETVIYGLDGGFESKSYIVNLRRNKDGTPVSARMLKHEDFERLIEITDSNLHRAASGIMQGIIDVKPLKSKNSDACKYCSGRSICNIALRK